jgi:hypothetical protein
MCGIWGGISSMLAVSEVDLIRMLGAVSFPRGDDSIGMAWVNGPPDKLKYGFDKAVGDPYGYLYHKSTVDFFRNLSTPRAIIGHNRSATVGAISRDNAHPFRKGDLVGVHNGTIRSLNPTYGTTDSEKLYELMSEKGPREVLNALNEGAYALVWFNCKENKMFMIRNDERPLFYMHTKHKPGTIYFASERSFLAYIDARPGTPQFDDPILLTSGSLYEFDLKKMGEPVVHADFVEKKPSRTFQRKAEGFNSPVTWENWEDYYKEDEKEEAPKVAQLFPMLPPPEPKKAPETNTIDENMTFFNNFFEEDKGTPWQVSGNVPSSTRETQDKVYDVVPATLCKIPRSVLLPPACGGYKTLRYRGYNNKLLTLNEYFHKLKQGSILNGTVPAPTTKIFWFNEKEFALEEELDDNIINEYYDDRSPPQIGELVYVNPNKAVNRLIGTTKKGSANVH